MSLLPDWSFFYQLVVFWLSILVLHKLLFKPMLQVFEAREKAHLAPKAKAEEMKTEVERLEAEIAEALENARQKAEDIRNAELKSASEKEQSELEKAKGEADEILKSSRDQLGRQVQEAKQQLEIEAGKLADTLSSKLLEIDVRRQA